MKSYYYLLFSIYHFYVDRMRENHIPLFYTSAVSSVLIGFNLLAIHSFLKYFGLVSPIQNRLLLLTGAFLLWIVNHYLVVKKERFLHYDFKNTLKGKVLVISYILLTAIFAIGIANLNRTKLAQERRQDHIKTEEVEMKKPSLESKVREWFEETF